MVRAARRNPARLSVSPRGTAPPTDRVVGHICRLIEGRRLKPGDRLPTERDLAREMKVSRASVRSGLRSLAAMGVLRSRQGAGTFIQDGPPNLDSQPLGLLAALHGFSTEEMFEARGVLEVGVAGLSAQRASGEQMATMAEEVASMFAAETEPHTFLVHDVRFHRAVAAGSNNPVLAALVEMTSTLLFERRRTYLAIRRGSAEAARIAMAEHLRLAEEALAVEDALAVTRAAVAKATGGRRPAAGR